MGSQGIDLGSIEDLRCALGHSVASCLEEREMVELLSMLQWKLGFLAHTEGLHFSFAEFARQWVKVVLIGALVNQLPSDDDSLCLFYPQEGPN